MTDVFSETQRSYVMSRVGSRDTKPERIVRSFLHGQGFRFRLHVPDLPGRPDLVLPKYKAVVFVHGCFWHRHKGCRRATTPRTRKEFWDNKFERNVKRDKESQRALKKAGWKVEVVWECELSTARGRLERLAGLASAIDHSTVT